jgi:hypothetical protein
VNVPSGLAFVPPRKPPSTLTRSRSAIS